MKVNFSLFYLMPVLVISDLAATNKDLELDGRSRSSRRLLWKSEHHRRVQSKHNKTSSTSSQREDQQLPHETDKNRKSNIVLILTDDQDVELGSLNFMLETSRLLKEGGAEFRHAYTTTPMCCPSRSSMFTGLYVHNHNVYTNNDNCSNIHWQLEHETKSFATYLANAGYHTGYFGKYLNKYNGSYIPAGWKEWGGLIMNSKYYNYSVNQNGRRVRHGDNYYKDYYTDLVANNSINFLKQWSTWNSNKPALLVMSFPAPHGPEDSAPRYSNMFLNVTTHHTPSYDYAPNPDKQWILQVTGPMMPIHKQFTNILMTKRLQTLQSVDTAVKRVFEQLVESGELENTYIIYTSDHGYHLGQFGLVKGKSFPFEFDVRVPFLVRGPGIEPGSIVNEIALNIDLAPTILNIAGISVPAYMDGRSLMKLFHKRKMNSRKYLINWPDTFLIESSGRREASFTGIHVVHEVKNDSVRPEIQNLSNSISVITDSISSSSSSPVNSDQVESEESKLANYNSFNNEDSFDFNNANTPSKAERLSRECQRAEFVSPCKIGQKWHCVLKDNRWRKHKCKFTTARLTSQRPRLQKCTCITEDGIVYMRFQTLDNNTNIRSHDQVGRFDGIQSSTIMHYLKPNKSSEELVNELANSWRIMKRQRREASGEESSDNNSNKNTPMARTIAILDVIDGQIIELPVSNNETNNSTACIISLDGSVQCSPEVFRNPYFWRANQQSIAAQIKKLRNQIKKLKEIQRHLDNMQSNYITAERNDDSIFGNVSHRVTVNSQPELPNTFSNRRTEFSISHKHRHHHQGSEPFQARHANDEEPIAAGNEHTIPDTCYCILYAPEQLTTKNMLKEQKRRIKEQKLKKKQRKLKKRAKLGKVCYLEKMNCFNHDNDHWRTPPYWTEGPFCFCMNANNNSYNCIRTINATHNFLYCEFVTGLTGFYNLRIDPFQQWNRYNSLSKNEKSWLKDTLNHMVKCKGHKDCGLNKGLQQMNVKVSNDQGLSKDGKNERRALRYQGT